ncbi:hypothetical protein [Clostridium gasigenes]|uniref:Uncharacterized protein n=1 Tax=Clostridium gasigenes TaxID=94869 RepID=A0A1H0N341_9CLOT|nr:hypothetical protein [Clostridium gasigenes]SDO87129.1 hypothetical protein SAMN04488529_101671 [Clostridium gasigenes]
MEYIELTIKFIKKMIDVNGLALVGAIVLQTILMATVTKITGDKSWFKKMMEGSKNEKYRNSKKN